MTAEAMTKRHSVMVPEIGPDPFEIGVGEPHDERREHQEHADRQEAGRGDQHEDDALDAPVDERPRLDDAVGAVERGPQRLDAVRGEEGGQQHAEGQQVAALDGQHVDHLARDRRGDLLGPGVEDEVHGRLGECLGAEEARQRRGEDQERKQRHQRRDRQMARHRPAVVGVEMAERVVEHAPQRDEPSHQPSPSDCLPAREYGKGLRQMASAEPTLRRLHERVAHNHRHRRIVRHRRLLRAGAEARRLARVRDGAQAGGYRRARRRRHRGVLSRLSRAGIDRGAGGGGAGAHRRHARRALQQRRLCPARRRRGPAGRRLARAVRGQFLRLARPDAPHRAGHAQRRATAASSIARRSSAWCRCCCAAPTSPPSTRSKG